MKQFYPELAEKRARKPLVKFPTTFGWASVFGLTFALAAVGILLGWLSMR